jgi:hypothetical protein
VNLPCILEASKHMNKVPMNKLDLFNDMGKMAILHQSLLQYRSSECKESTGF